MNYRLACWLSAGLLCVVCGCRTRLLDTASPETPGGGDLSLFEDSGLPTDGFRLPPDYNFPLFDLTVPRQNCGVYTIETTQVIRADLLIIQDRSRSMAQGPNGENNPAAGQSKWEQVREALKQVVSKTTSVDWGLLLYGNGQQCGVNSGPDVPVAPGNGARIRQVLDATQLAPSTPTTAAINSALRSMIALNDKHPHYLMVATDGQPTCRGGAGNADDSAAAIAAVKAAAAAGVQVFVVGIGANNGAESTLDAMGKAGGVPNTTPGQPAYFSVSSTADLVKVLEAAALRITPCIYPLANPPPAPDRVTIQSRGGIVPRDVTHVNGWDYGVDMQDIVFYGESCNELQIGVVLTVEAIYGCPGDMP